MRTRFVLVLMFLAAPALLCAQEGPPVTVTIPAKTKLTLRFTEDVDTQKVYRQQNVRLTTAGLFQVSEKLAIAPGIFVTAVVTKARRPGRFFGKAELGLEISSLMLGDEYIVLPIDEIQIGEEITKGSQMRIRGKGSIGRDVRDMVLFAAPLILLRRGEHLVIPKGTFVDIVLSRNLVLQTKHLPLVELLRMCPCSGEADSQAEKP